MTARSDFVANVSFNAILKGGGPSAAILEISALERMESKSGTAKSPSHCSIDSCTDELNAGLSRLADAFGNSAADAQAFTTHAAMKALANQRLRRFKGIPKR